MGNFAEPPEWREVLKHFRGNELQQFFTRMLEENMKALIKIQYVDSVAKQKNVNQAIVGRRLRNLDKKGIFDEAVEQLDLGKYSLHLSFTILFNTEKDISKNSHEN